MGITDPGAKPETQKPPVEPTPAPAAPPEPEDELVKLIKADPNRTAEEIRQLRKEAADNRKKATKAEEERQAAEKKKLEEQGEFKTLAERQKQEIDDLKASQKKDKIHAAVALEAVKAGIADPADALKLADLSKVDVSEAGEVSGVVEAIAALVKAKPYLVKSEQALPGIGASNPAGGPGLTARDLAKMSALEIKAMNPDDVTAALQRK